MKIMSMDNIKSYDIIILFGIYLEWICTLVWQEKIVNSIFAENFLVLRMKEQQQEFYKNFCQ